MPDPEESSPDEKLYRIRHSLAHVMAQAVLEMREGSTLGFGPPIDDGFYYDFILSEPLTESDFPELEQRMRRILKKGQRFYQEEVPVEEAFARLEEMGEPYKREYAQELVERDTLESLSFYRNGPFLDMCEGPHVDTTREIARDAFKLRSVAGAYWRGDSANVMMTRIYAWAFADKETLDDTVAAFELAQERDHKKLGRELDLFTFDDDVGRGLPLWMPHGTVIRDELEKLAVELEFKAGYERVATPHIAKSGLYAQTGHLDHYRESMYPPMEVVEETPDGVTLRESYMLKPMNCPHHHKIYAARLRSYRDLPLRLAEYGQVYRWEASGAVSGLARVRMLSMNDAHIYCTENQIRDVFREVISEYDEAYRILGLTDYTIRLSRWDPDDPKGREKYVDAPEDWERTEAIIADLLDSMDIAYEDVRGEAAFYGPQARRHVPDRHRQGGTAVNGAARLCGTAADRSQLRRGRWCGACAVLYPPCAAEYPREVRRTADRALRRGLPHVARTGTGAGDHRLGALRRLRPRPGRANAGQLRARRTRLGKRYRFEEDPRRHHAQDSQSVDRR